MQEVKMKKVDFFQNNFWNLVVLYEFFKIFQICIACKYMVVRWLCMLSLCDYVCV